MNVGIVSGFFSPVCHLGHVQYIQEAKRLSDFLIVIVNNDTQARLKGSKIYMKDYDRVKFIQSIRGVDLAILSIDDKDTKVCDTLRLLYKIFGVANILTVYNSGDRKPDNTDEPSLETQLCKELGVRKIFLDLPKIYSSSDL